MFETKPSVETGIIRLLFVSLVKYVHYIKAIIQDRDCTLVVCFLGEKAESVGFEAISKGMQLK